MAALYASQMSRRLPLVFAITSISLAWGAIPLIVREDIPATQLVATRVLLGGIAMLAVLVVRRDVSIPRDQIPRVVGLGAILAAHWLTFFVAIKTTSVAVALAILYLGPMMASLLAPRILGERFSRKAALGLAPAVIGTMLVLSPGSGATLQGIALAGVSATLVTALMLIGKPAAAAVGGMKVATYEMLAAAALLFPWSVAAARESAHLWKQLLVLGVLLTGVAFAIYWVTMVKLPVATTAVLMYLEPASAAVLAAIVLGEKPPAYAWLGIALVILGGITVAVMAEDPLVELHPAG
jgi:drug/metabolite transporter (DMT)-like permease